MGLLCRWPHFRVLASKPRIRVIRAGHQVQDQFLWNHWWMWEQEEVMHGIINTDRLALAAVQGMLWWTPVLLYSQVFAEDMAVMCGIASLYRAAVCFRNTLSICPSAPGPEPYTKQRGLDDPSRIVCVYVCACPMCICAGYVLGVGHKED